MKQTNTRLDKATAKLDTAQAAFELAIKGNKKPMIITGDEEVVRDMYIQAYGVDPEHPTPKARPVAVVEAPRKPKVGFTHLINVLSAKIAQKRAIEQEYKTWLKAYRAAQEIDRKLGTSTAAVLKRDRHEKIYKAHVKLWNEEHGQSIDVKLLPATNRNADGSNFVKRDQHGFIVS